MPPTGYKKRRHKWTREDVIQKINDWADEFGEPPTGDDWNPSNCARSARISVARSQRWLARGARFHTGEYPWTGTVQKLFGSWNEAIEAAGFEPRTRKIELPEIEVDKIKAIGEIKILLSEAQRSEDSLVVKRMMYSIAETALRTAEGVES